MNLKAINVLSISASTASAITKDDVVFIISILIIILQMVSAYIAKKEKKN